MPILNLFEKLSFKTRFNSQQQKTTHQKLLEKNSSAEIYELFSEKLSLAHESHVVCA